MNVVLIRGAGDLASGIAHRLMAARIPVMMNELKEPTMIRRTVSFGTAVYDGTIEIEGIKAVYTTVDKAQSCVDSGCIPVLTEPYDTLCEKLSPKAVVDAILAKRNLGTKRKDAPIVIGVGPGFTAPEEVQFVVETKRGHYLGTVYDKGQAIPNTGIPGNVGGYTIERVLHAPCEGIWQAVSPIGSFVEAGEVVAHIGDVPVQAKITGVLRGSLQSGLYVKKGMKVGDIDSRCKTEHCYTISDKARAVGGGVLEAILKGGWYDA